MKTKEEVLNGVGKLIKPEFKEDFLHFIRTGEITNPEFKVYCETDENCDKATTLVFDYQAEKFAEIGEIIRRGRRASVNKEMVQLGNIMFFIGVGGVLLCLVFAVITSEFRFDKNEQNVFLFFGLLFLIIEYLGFFTQKFYKRRS